MLCFKLAWRFVIARKRPMFLSLAGIVFGVSFFVVTQAQTSGFEKFFIQTILGTNGALRISDRFQDTYGTVEQVDDDGDTRFLFHSREGSLYHEGVDQPSLIRDALDDYPELLGVSEIIEGSAVLDTGFRRKSIVLNGIRWEDHLQSSDLNNQIIQGTMNNFSSDQMGVILGSRISQRLGLKIGDRVSLVGGTGNLHLRVSAIFESGVSQIDKNRIYIHLITARSFLGSSSGGSVFQIAINEPEHAPGLAVQLQSSLNHRVVSWQERERVWLDVFKALRFSSAITVSCILLLSGLGMFNVFAILVIEKTRDIAILRSIGFSRMDISAIFLWQGTIVLVAGITIGSLFAASGTYLISMIPLRIRGIFSTDSFVVNWDLNHYLWASCIAFVFVAVATWIPARRAARIEPAKIIRETL
ncbi:FtsX-like permease family protein [bacterium]|uniref:ABC transporter permease n=1 Tax=Candidatus Chordibacter forsetii TaxID=3381758 RepID=UPI0023164161|nr:FtsX-like permease family protein [bacterium]